MEPSTQIGRASAAASSSDKPRKKLCLIFHPEGRHYATTQERVDEEERAMARVLDAVGVPHDQITKMMQDADGRYNKLSDIIQFLRKNYFRCFCVGGFRRQEVVGDENSFDLACRAAVHVYKSFGSFSAAIPAIHSVQKHIQRTPPMAASLRHLLLELRLNGLEAYSLNGNYGIHDFESLFHGSNRMNPPTMNTFLVREEIQIAAWKIVQSVSVRSPLRLGVKEDPLDGLCYREYKDAELRLFFLKIGFSPEDLSVIYSFNIQKWNEHFHCWYSLLLLDSEEIKQGRGRFRNLSPERRQTLTLALDFMGRSSHHPILRLVHFDLDAFGAISGVIY